MPKVLGLPPAAPDAQAGPSLEAIAGAEGELVLPPAVDEEPLIAGKKGADIKDVIAKLQVPEGMFGKVMSGLHNTIAEATHDDVFKLKPEVEDAWDQLLALTLGAALKDMKYAVIVLLIVYVGQAEAGMLAMHLQNVKLAKEAAAHTAKGASA